MVKLLFTGFGYRTRSSTNEFSRDNVSPSVILIVVLIAGLFITSTVPEGQYTVMELTDESEPIPK